MAANTVDNEATGVIQVTSANVLTTPPRMAHCVVDDEAFIMEGNHGRSGPLWMLHSRYPPGVDPSAGHSNGS